MSTTDTLIKAKIVYLILSQDTEEALELLSQHYEVAVPKLKVGMPKRYSKNPACYVGKSRTIHVAQRDVLWNPHIILHEFYHQGATPSTQRKFQRNRRRFKCGGCNLRGATLFLVRQLFRMRRLLRRLSRAGYHQIRPG